MIQHIKYFVKLCQKSYQSCKFNSVKGIYIEIELSSFFRTQTFDPNTIPESNSMLLSTQTIRFSGCISNGLVTSRLAYLKMLPTLMVLSEEPLTILVSSN